MMTTAAAAPTCEACGEPGADACIRMTSEVPEESSRAIYWHNRCAQGRGIAPLYLLVVVGDA